MNFNENVTPIESTKTEERRHIDDTLVLSHDKVEEVKPQEHLEVNNVNTVPVEITAHENVKNENVPTINTFPVETVETNKIVPTISEVPVETTINENVTTSTVPIEVPTNENVPTINTVPVESPKEITPTQSRWDIKAEETVHKESNEKTNVTVPPTMTSRFDIIAANELATKLASEKVNENVPTQGTTVNETHEKQTVPTTVHEKEEKVNLENTTVNETVQSLNETVPEPTNHTTEEITVQSHSNERKISETQPEKKYSKC